MKKIKVSIMTNKSYPTWKVKKAEIIINENEKNYYWSYEDIKAKYQDSEDEYPVDTIIENC